MKNDLITIIIPVYNSKQYLEKCVESVIKQTYNNLEIILINDGSTDDSGKLCDKLKKKDKRIKVIHQENKGVSYVRNIGIEKSIGKYITFVDSDDWIHPDFCQKLYNNIIENNCDLSICNVLITCKDNKQLRNKKEKIILLNQNQAYEMMINNNGYAGYMCNKLYKKELINQMQEKLDINIHYCEDLLFNTKYLLLCNNIVYTQTKLYYYYQNPSSTTKKIKYNNKMLTVFEAYKQIYKIYEEKNIKNKDLIIYKYLNTRLNINYKIKKNKEINNFELKEEKMLAKFYKSKSIGIITKTYIYICYLFPMTTSKIKYKINNFIGKII